MSWRECRLSRALEEGRPTSIMVRHSAWLSEPRYNNVTTTSMNSSKLLCDILLNRGGESELAQ
jgi:hypothetical protein